MNKNALIVDDSRLACKIMENMLDTMGIQSVSVHSAADALDYLKRKLPDIIFLDHTMPDMDGFETIKLIKDNPLTATVPVMMYTAKQGEVYVGQARALGAVDVLPKGMEKGHLSKALQQMGFITTDKNDVNKESPRSERIESIKQAKQPETAIEQPQPINDSSWQDLWQMKIEPFLRLQTKSHSDEIQYSSSQLGLKLNRRIHQTLEQFEHALVSRIEAHDDYKDSKDELKKKQTLKLIFAIGILIVFMQLGIFWQLYQGNKFTNALLLAQEEQQIWNYQLNGQLAGLKTQLELLEEKSEIVDEIEDTQVAQTVSLVDEFGVVISQNLYLSNEDKAEYSGITSSGYQFIVNEQGKVGAAISNRYYQTSDCTDTAFVDSVNAMIYRGNKGGIWYINKLAVATNIAVGSTFNEAGECIPGDGTIISLKALERSNYLETGIDETQILRLIYK